MNVTSKTVKRDDVFQKVKDIVIDALHAQGAANEINEDTYLGNLGLDSLNVVDVLLGLERDFDISFDDDELDFEALETLGSLTDFVLQSVGHNG